MSNSSELSETTMTKSPEESSFSKTCNRLREYLKENGSLGDVNLGISLAAENGCGISSAKSQMLPRSVSSMDLFPQESSKAGDYRCVAMEPKKAQMTIFYGGQIMVFNDISAGKAMEVMRLASVASCHASNTPIPATHGPSVMPKESIAISPPGLGEIPIARKQSLARFLEKRKDRIMARSPYSSVNNNFTKGAISASMPADKSWLGLAGS